MLAILDIENFGPIKNAKLEFSSVNVLIGPQASGKSALAKLYSICKTPYLYLNQLDLKKNEEISEEIFVDLSNQSKLNIKKFREALDYYSIGSFFKKNTKIIFNSSTHSVSIDSEKFTYIDKINLIQLRDSKVKKDYSKFNTSALEFAKISSDFKFEYSFNLYRNNLTDLEFSLDEFKKFYLNPIVNPKDFKEIQVQKMYEAAVYIKEKFAFNQAIYVPAERNIISLLRQSAYNLRLSNIPLPPHLLDYTAQFEAASFHLKELSLNFLTKKTTYKNVNGSDRIFFNGEESILLSESASGFQSVVPLLLPIEFKSSTEETELHAQNISFVIEEPESNLFPEAQYSLLKYLESKRTSERENINLGASHIYTTHSPYILSSLNNMLFAFKMGNKASIKTHNKIQKIIPEDSWIDPVEFNAYEIKNGKVKSIFNKKTGLIKENSIDNVSDKIINDFRKIGMARL